MENLRRREALTGDTGKSKSGEEAAIEEVENRAGVDGCATVRSADNVDIRSVRRLQVGRPDSRVGTSTVAMHKDLGVFGQLLVAAGSTDTIEDGAAFLVSGDERCLWAFVVRKAHVPTLAQIKAYERVGVPRAQRGDSPG